VKYRIASALNSARSSRPRRHRPAHSVVTIKLAIAIAIASAR
jgi:hypothetical protein